MRFIHRPETGISKNFRYVKITLVFLALALGTTGLTYYGLLDIADQKSARILDDESHFISKLLSRDVDDLRQQIVKATGSKENPAFKPILTFRKGSDGFFIAHSHFPRAEIEIQNASKSPFRGSLGVGGSIRASLFDLSGTELDRNSGRILGDHNISKTLYVDQSNLKLVTSLSLDEERQSAGAVAGILLLFWGGVWIFTVIWMRRSFENNAYLMEWVRVALREFKFGRVCPPHEPEKLGKDGNEIVSKISQEFNLSIASQFSPFLGMQDSSVKLVNWSHFLSKISAVVSTLDDLGQVLVGKIRFSDEDLIPEFLKNLSRHVGSIGELTQCIYLEDVLIFALVTREEKTAVKLFVDFIRELMKLNRIRAGQFFSRVLVFDDRSMWVNPENLISKLHLNEEIKDWKTLTKSAGTQMHLVIHEGLSDEKTVSLNWIQLLSPIGMSFSRSKNRVGLDKSGICFDNTAVRAESINSINLGEF